MAENTIKARIQIASKASTDNSILRANELAYLSDKKTLVVGDGSTKISSLSPIKSLTFGGTLWGQVYEGNNNVTGDLIDTGNITPKTSNTYNIGSSSNYWNNLYVKNLNLPSISPSYVFTSPVNQDEFPITGAPVFRKLVWYDIYEALDNLALLKGLCNSEEGIGNFLQKTAIDSWALTTVYAPTTSGTTGNLLLATSGSAPTWTNFTFPTSSTTKVLSYKGGTGWQLMAPNDHSHSLSIAAASGTSQINLAANTLYKLTAGGSTYLFKTPPAGSSSGGYSSLTMPTEFSVAGSGTASITVTKNTQNANKVYASPINTIGTPEFRALTINDLPTTALTQTYPKHYDMFLGADMGDSNILTIDAPYYCTDLKLEKDLSQYVTDDLDIAHLTIWPGGGHSLMSGNAYANNNWLACMMTSWFAGHPMSVSYIAAGGLRKWIPLVYTGPLKVSNGNGTDVVITVSIDLGAAIILTLVNYGISPFAAFTDPYVTKEFFFYYSVGMNPITFKYFSHRHNGCNNLAPDVQIVPIGMENGTNLVTLLHYVNLKNKEKHLIQYEQLKSQFVNNFIDYCTTHKVSEDLANNTVAGDGIPFLTWTDIINQYGHALVCTSLPNITGIQQ